MPRQLFRLLQMHHMGQLPALSVLCATTMKAAPLRGVVADAHTALAEKALLEICHEAINFWDDVSLYVEHAKGTLKIGDASVVIAAGSPHRDNAFAACRFIIEEIKKRVPVWKQEQYADGTDAWIGGNSLNPVPQKSGCGCGGCGCGGK